MVTTLLQLNNVTPNYNPGLTIYIKIIEIIKIETIRFENIDYNLINKFIMI